MAIRKSRINFWPSSNAAEKPAGFVVGSNPTGREHARTVTRADMGTAWCTSGEVRAGMSDIINAQHEETGRMWSGPRDQLPKGFSEVQGFTAAGRNLHYEGLFEGETEGQRTERLRSASQQENELICEKLLGWKRRGDGRWFYGQSLDYPATPTFTDWQSRGLIIDALQKAWPMSRPALNDLAERIRTGAVDESVVRSLALSYLRARE